MLDLIQFLFDVFFHLDKHLSTIITAYGALTYGLLFFIIFCETGFVVTPFLPGDSLLFAAGVFASKGDLSVIFLIILLSIAAVLGDTVNYWIGNIVGPRVFRKENVRFLNKKHLDRTHEFFEKYGPETIIIARFVPIVRTFAPFVAGIGSMSYSRFFTYNVFGGLLWVNLLTLGGFFFANVPVVKNHFSFVVVAIIIVSVLPGVYEFLRQRKEARKKA